MFEKGAVSHSEMVEALARGRWDRMRVDPRIARSWNRSAGRSLDPSGLRRPQVLPAYGLREMRTPLEPLLHVARSSVETLFRQVRDAGYVILLTNPDGVTVDFMGKPSLDRELREAGLYLGGVWPEGAEGTNAIGMCAIENSPITVHQAEHFRARNARLTCSAAPLRSETGELMAVLDASALYSPDDKRSQLLVLQLVAASARAIEYAYFLQRFGQQWVLRVGCSKELLEISNEGLIALDEGGRVLAANAHICEQLGTEQRQVTGRSVDEVLGVSFSRIADAASKFAALPLPRLAAGAYGLVRRPPRPIPIGFSRPAEVTLATLAEGDPRMQASVEQARRALDKGIPFLLLGETGSGKELFAKALHQASARAGGPFVALNCAAIPESLIESELFGYRNGAFTGARAKGLRGKIAQANGGTLFLDEIGDMPLALQTRLLRVLSEREVQPLGTELPVPVDLQLICATHRDLTALVQAGTFRQDLYYRLNGIALQLPPLRRRADKAALIDKILLEEAASMGGEPCTLTEQARTALLRYSWPGNLRQLRNTLRSAVALSGTGPIEIGHLPAELHEAVAMPAQSSATMEPEPQAFEGREPLSRDEELLSSLRRHHWNLTRVARDLGIARATVYRRMARSGIVQPKYRS